MLDQSLIKSNAIGRDGFIWWIGQIPPEGNHHGQINGAGWGNRYKVRILGYDSPKISNLSNDELRWAQVMLPTTADLVQQTKQLVFLFHQETLYLVFSGWSTRLQYTSYSWSIWQNFIS